MIDIKEIKNAINFMAKEKNIEKEKHIETSFEKEKDNEKDF